MEEKERYIIDRFDEDIFDTKKEYYPSNQTICEIINQQDKRIKELEEKYQDLKEDNDATTESLYASRTYLDKNTSKMWVLEKENKQLKQQLAEKDKEIERLNLEFETQEDWQEKWQKLYDETCNLNQDKISFAIEQLEKVKDYAQHIQGGLINYIDNQIKQLKEMK